MTRRHKHRPPPPSARLAYAARVVAYSVTRFLTATTTHAPGHLSARDVLAALAKTGVTAVLLNAAGDYAAGNPVDWRRTLATAVVLFLKATASQFSSGPNVPPPPPDPATPPDQGATTHAG